MPIADETPRSRARAAAAALAAGLWSALLFLVLRFPPDGREHANLGQFVGRLHPLLVHGPVALLVLVPAMELAARRARWAHLRQAAGPILSVAAVAAFAAAFDGWLLAWSGGYRGHDVTRHLWGGVSLAAVCAAAAWARGIRSRPNPAYPPLLIAALALMIWTGHGGGSISHGDGFLTDKMPAGLRAWIGMPAMPGPVGIPAVAAPPARAGRASLDPANPAFYRVHVEPVLARSCVSCHKPEKHKGKLRLDSYEQLMRGGEDGPAVIPGNPGKSELIRRVLLPAGDDDSMPSDGDKPLTPEEIQTIERWIAAGAKSG